MIMGLQSASRLRLLMFSFLLRHQPAAAFHVRLFLFQAAVIRSERTANKKLAEIKQRGDNGGDYFRITAAGKMARHCQARTKEFKSWSRDQ